MRNNRVSWYGDGTEFASNNAKGNGGAIYALGFSPVSWDAGGTTFTSNSVAENGGALYTDGSPVSCGADSTEFTYNNASFDGGAIYATGESTVSWDGNMDFCGNFTGGNGGALVLVDVDLDNFYFMHEPFTGATFIENRAGTGGGALHLLNCGGPLNFTDVTFQSNSASTGGTVAAYVTGDVYGPATFLRCIFSDNVATVTGGAVDPLSGYQEFVSCDFLGNSAGEKIHPCNCS